MNNLINPYLTFPGTTEAAMNFYKSAFGGEFAMVQRYKETPEADKVLPGDLDKMMHMALPIGKGNVLMASDSVESMGRPVSFGTNFSLSVSADSRDEAEKLFGKLSSGGTVTMPMSDTFWGSYFGMLTDKFGIQWMVSFDANPQP
jgi:PhnB protein